MISQWVISVLFFLISLQASASANIIVEKVVHAKKEVIESDLKQRKILGTLYGLSKEIETISNKRSHLEKKLFSTQGEIKELSRDIAVLKEKLKDQRVHLGKRLQTIYKFNNMGGMSLLMSSQKGNLDKNIKFLKLIAKQDVKHIRQYNSQILKLDKQKSKLKEKVAGLLKYKSRVKASEISLEKNQLAKTKILIALRQDKKKALESLKSWRKQAKTLKISDAELKNLLSSEFFENKGKLQQPVEGEIYQKYGLHYDYDYKFKLNERGVVFRTKNDPVSAVFNGVVEYVGPLRGLKHIIVLNHGDNYFTVYGNLKSTNVIEGDQVNSGEVIGSLGSKSGGVKKLSFQIRHFSDPVDPEIWFNKKLLVSNE